MKNVIILLCAFFLCFSCRYTNSDDSHQFITIVNKTNKKLYIFGSTGYPNIDEYKSHPDPLYNVEQHKVEAYETTNNVLASGTSYEFIYKDFIPSGIMMVYVFDGETLETQGWDYIKNNNLVYKRYDLTLQDFNSMNWTLTIE